jgi:hypothetical protein
MGISIIIFLVIGAGREYWLIVAKKNKEEKKLPAENQNVQQAVIRYMFNEKK